MKIKAIVTGATGMVGEGVMHECLNHPDVESVLVINRRTINPGHPNLKEIIHNNFYDFSGIEEQIKGFNACFFCLGTTSVGKKEDEYTRITFDITKALADILVRHNPQMTFCYISGSGTDSSEKGKIMWARVKGKTENYILNLGFRQAFAFRPAIIEPTKGLKNTLAPYKYLSFLIPVIRLILPKHICSLKEIGIAMINSVIKGNDKKILEVADIIKLANN
ncbi:MAG: NAD-dependent epimerase/dehydratase family protein [Ignavibacteriaceae bacterium]